MNKTRIIPLIALLAFLTLGAGTSQAQKPIPGITQTSQWKSMKAFVNTLESRKTTPATPTQKTSYRTRLNAKQQGTNQRVKQLYAQAVKRLTARDSRKERAAIKKVREQQSRAISEIKANLAARVALAQQTYANAVSKIKANFNIRTASLKASLRTLRRNLARTTDPFQRQLILEKIDAAKQKLAGQKAIRKSEITPAGNYRNNQIRKITLRYDRKINSTRAYYKGLVRTVKESWKTIYRSNLRAAKARRASQFELVSTLKSRGSGYIDQMPDASTCRTVQAVC